MDPRRRGGRLLDHDAVTATARWRNRTRARGGSAEVLEGQAYGKTFRAEHGCKRPQPARIHERSRRWRCGVGRRGRFRTTIAGRHSRSRRHTADRAAGRPGSRSPASPHTRYYRRAPAVGLHGRRHQGAGDRVRRRQPWLELRLSPGIHHQLRRQFSAGVSHLYPRRIIRSHGPRPTRKSKASRCWRCFMA